MTAALNSGHYSNGRSRSPLRFPFRLPETGLPCNMWPPPLFFRHILACHHPPTHLPTARLGNETLFRRRGRVAQDLRLLGRVAQPAQLGRAFLTRTRQAAWQRGDPTYLSRARGSSVCAASGSRSWLLPVVFCYVVQRLKWGLAQGCCGSSQVVIPALGVFLPNKRL